MARAATELTSAEKRGILRSVPLFGELSPEALEGLADVAQTRVAKKREELFHKGDEATHAYVIVSGRLKALTTSGAGDDIVFSVLQPGELVGEIALLAETRRTATVAAIEACQLLSIGRDAFYGYLRSSPEIAIGLLKAMALRIKKISELVEDTHFLNLPLRLAKKLVNFADEYGRETEAGTRIDLKLSQEEWGDLVGATRESINKQMRTWSQEGVMTLEKGYVTIHRMDEIVRLAKQAVV